MRAEALEIHLRKSTATISTNWCTEYGPQLDCFKSVGHQFRILRIEIDQEFSLGGTALVEKVLKALASATHAARGLQTLNMSLYWPLYSPFYILRFVLKRILQKSIAIEVSESVEFQVVPTSLLNGEKQCLYNASGACRESDCIKKLEKAIKGIDHALSNPIMP